MIRTGWVVGHNLYRVRSENGESQTQCARRVSEYGLEWTRDQVASLELGRRESITIDELIILSAAYRVSLDSWFQGTDSIDVAGCVSMSRESIRATLRGVAPIIIPTPPVDAPPLECDVYVANRLGVNHAHITHIARSLWGRTLTEERDHRLDDSPDKDPKVMRTKRAGVTKQLMAEIKGYI